MAGIAGILKEGKKDDVSRMIELLAHRGNMGKRIVEKDGATIGIVWSLSEDDGMDDRIHQGIFRDGPGFGHKLEITKPNGHWQISRDETGVAPMYITLDCDGNMCFASEVKALLRFSTEIFEIPSGSRVSETDSLKYFSLEQKAPMQKDPDAIASELLNLLSFSVSRRINSETIGISLSGGLNSGAIAALTRPWVTNMHTFTVGLDNAPDFHFAREMAKHLGSKHHEVIIDLDTILRNLPLLIYHLESFDVSLVRSGIVNYLAGDQESGYVGEVFTGAGGDELFAGYDFSTSQPQARPDVELPAIINRLHNTTLQCIDRCAAAYGLRAHVAFTDPQVVDYAITIPTKFKFYKGIERWILRKALDGILPKEILKRSKEVIWDGSGVGDIILKYASSKITDKDFMTERFLSNGWTLKTKEELFYYRIFREFFGEKLNLAWMGRIN